MAVKYGYDRAASGVGAISTCTVTCTAGCKEQILFTFPCLGPGAMSCGTTRMWGA